MKQFAICLATLLCNLVCAPIDAQGLPAATSGVVYMRSDTVAYPAGYLPASGLPNARIGLSGQETVTDANGAFSVPSSTVPTHNTTSLAVTLANYMPAWYPWIPDDAKQILPLALYPKAAAAARPGFISAIVPHDMGGFLPGVYAEGMTQPTFARIRSVAGANMVAFADPAWVTAFDVATNSVTMGPSPLNANWGMASRSMYETMVSDAKGRGLQFMMLLGIEGDGSLGNRFTSVPFTNGAFWDAWFAAYQPLVLERTAIARDLGIEYVAIGYDLGYLWPLGPTRWQRLIAAMRGIGYTGKIVNFAAASFVYQQNPYDQQAFADGSHDRVQFMGLFDAIGITFYDGIARTSPGEVVSNDQARAHMRSGVKAVLDSLSVSPVPVLVMIGVPSVHGGVSTGEYIEPCLPCNSVAPLRTRDYDQQADFYQAVSEVINDSPTGNGHVMGLFSWGYHYRDDPTWGSSPGDSAYDKSASIRGKPAEAVMRSWSERWSVGATTAIEYHHAEWDHYFMTSIPGEISALDSGAFAGWTRTGESFNVYPTDTPGMSNQCRFFSTAFAPKSSHFYTALSSECEILKQNANWQFEGLVAALAIPDGGGGCAPNMRSLYRLYNNGQGAAPNHRYTTSLAIRSDMIAKGWIPEGFGTDGVIACVPV